MFIIKYLVTEEERIKISNIKNLEELENLHDVMGQIQITINTTIEGFVDNDNPYEGDFLFTWFELLNAVLNQLNKNSFVAITLPGLYNIWFEFHQHGEEVIISKIKAKKEDHMNEYIINEPKRRSELIWCNSISRSKLYETIVNSTDDFIKDLLSINRLLSQIKIFKILNNEFIEAKRSL